MSSIVSQLPNNGGLQDEPRIAVVFSPGIRAIRNLCVLADVDEALTVKQLKRRKLKATCVLVWGRKSNTAAALKYAQENELAIHYLEDGWIRSSSSNPHSRTCYSVLKDTTGVYYDSRTPCDLENLLNLTPAAFSEVVSAAQIEYAQSCRQRLVKSNITKYNFTSMKIDNADFMRQSRGKKSVKRVLVVDQTRDDASVIYGDMDAQKFEAMLHTAIEENPDSRIVVRIHPDVVNGVREGYLDKLANQLVATSNESGTNKTEIEISADALNPMLLLKQVDKVYVGTSQLGYEALLCEIPVVVFGQPFYSGWGLTDDRSTIARRTQQRSIDEMFYATHVALARYCNPVTGEAWHLDECLAHVELQQRMYARNALHFECVAITPWKQNYMRQFLRSPDGSVSFLQDSLLDHSLLHQSFLKDNANKRAANDSTFSDDNSSLLSIADDTRPKTVKLTWSYRAYGDIAPTDEQAVDDQPLYRIEDGFLRGSGLGSDFNAPASLVVDGQGLYFDPTRKSDLETLIGEYECTPEEIFRAVSLKKLILSSRLSKYNVGQESNLVLPEPGMLHVLVVGQVEDDQSIQRGCDEVRTNAELLKRVRQLRPEAWIRYKPHPDVVAGNRKGDIDEDVLRENANAVDAEASIIDCIDACDELHTMTSLSGFEALLRGKQVVTYGAPFYAGWGLTEEHLTIARRTRRRTLDELVYLTLIEYPRYVDIDTGEFMTPEDLVRKMKSQRAMNSKIASGWPARKIRKMANIYKGLRYAP